MGKYTPKKIPKSKPKFTEKDFVRGADIFGKQTAEHFLEFLKLKYINKQYDFKAIEQMLHMEKEHISPAELVTHIDAKNHIVFIKEGNVIDQVTYKELFTILEFGRKDKGIMPSPVLRPAFDEYRPIYRERVRSFLLGK